MTFDVIGIAQYFFEIQVGGHVLCTVLKFKAFPSRFAFENVSDRAKTVLDSVHTTPFSNKNGTVMLRFQNDSRPH